MPAAAAAAVAAVAGVCSPRVGSGASVTASEEDGGVISLSRGSVSVSVPVFSPCALLPGGGGGGCSGSSPSWPAGSVESFEANNNEHGRRSRCRRRQRLVFAVVAVAVAVICGVAVAGCIQHVGVEAGSIGGAAKAEAVWDPEWESSSPIAPMAVELDQQLSLRKAFVHASPHMRTNARGLSLSGIKPHRS